MQSKKLYPPHIMFHPASPTVMASQIGLSWGGLGLLCSCCCLIWGLGVLQVLTWLDLKDSQRHINILYETIDHSANESLASEKREHYVNIMNAGLQNQSFNSSQWGVVRLTLCQMPSGTAPQVATGSCPCCHGSGGWAGCSLIWKLGRVSKSLDKILNTILLFVCECISLSE